jgi:tetratricopeptide (TPR) repeat protein
VQAVDNMKTREELLNKLREATEAREHGRTDISSKIFANILSDIGTLKKSKDREDLNAYILVMSEYIIQLRHEGKRSYMKALKIGQDLYAFNKSEDLQNSRAVRGISNTLLNLEAYEVAFDYLKELISLTPKEDSARQGDALAHLARCMFRMGKLNQAESTLNDAIKGIEANSGKSSSIEIAVWKSHALIVKAIILNSKGNIKKALSEAESALEVAEESNVVPRINESTEIVNYLKLKIK